MINKQSAFKQSLSEYATIIKKLLSVSVCVPVAMVAACSSNSNNPTTSANHLQDNQKKQVGVLLPLTGRNGVLGNNMLKATRLAMSDPSSPKLDIHDTAQSGGAAEAARKAIEAGDGIILGPLTANDTIAVMTANNINITPVISYTSDVTMAGDNIWVFGITPEQQVLTLVRAAKNEGKTKFAALLPDNAFGRAMADGLTKACSDLGLMQPTIMYHTAVDGSDILDKLKILSDFDNRVKSAVPDSASATTSATTADQTDANGDNLLNELIPSGATAQKTDTSQLKLAPPPFDALLLSDTGVQLQSVMNAMKETQVLSLQVQVMGPGLWAAFASKLGALHGAWYAAPNPQQRQEFVRQYMAKYGQVPKPLSDLAYDSAALANALSKRGGYTSDNLLRPEGFDGVDGLFILKPDGHVQRNLQIFQLQPTGGGKIITLPTASVPVQPKT